MEGKLASVGKSSLAILLSLSLGLFLTPSAAFAADEQSGALTNEIESLEEGMRQGSDPASATEVDRSVLDDSIKSVGSGAEDADAMSFSASNGAGVSHAADLASTQGSSEYYLEQGLGKIDSWTGDGSIHGTVMHFSLSEGNFVTIETDVYNVDSALVSLNASDGEMLEVWAPEDGSVYGIFALPAGSYYLEFLSTSNGYSYIGAKYDAETPGWDEPAVFEQEDNAPDEGEPVSLASNRIPLDTWVAGSFYRLPALVDLDYFTFEVSVAGHYQFSLAATDSMLFGMVDEDASSLNAAQIPKGGGSAVLDLGYLQPGAYNLCVTSADIEAAGSIYNGMVSRVDGDEPSSGWSKWGSLEWQIADNCLSIRPAAGATEGHVESGSAPWFGEQMAEVTKVSITGTVKLGAGVNIASLFSNSMKLAEIEGLGNLDTSEVSDMTSMFRNCSSLASIDLSGLETDSLTNISSMFFGCFALEGSDSVDFAEFDTSGVKDASYLFAYCSGLHAFDLSAIDLSACENMEGMFLSCIKLKEIDFSGSDFSKANNVAQMFNSCAELESVDLSEVDFSKVENMWSMFSGCAKLVSLDLSTLDLSNVIDMGSLCRGCSALASLAVPDAFIGEKCENAAQIFDGCVSLKTIPGNFSFGAGDAVATGAFRTDQSSTPLETYYSGNDASVLGYDWESDGRTLIRVEELSGSITVQGNPCASSSLSATVKLDEASADAQLVYQWFDDSADTAVSEKSPSATLSVTPENAGEKLYCVVTDGSGKHPGSITSTAIEASHRYAEAWSSDASGHWHACEMCGAKGSVAEHSFGEWSTVKEPTCSATGSQERSCGACGFVEQEDIPMIDASGIFTDVPPSTDHFEAITWLACKKITTGFEEEDGTFAFRPYSNVARADMAAFLYRLAGSPDYEVTAKDLAKFNDVTDGSDGSEPTPHLKEVCWLANTGISTGFPDGSFRPYNSIARADMAAFLHRLAKWANATEPVEDGKIFTDVDATIAHAEDIAWLSAAGITTGFKDNTFRPYNAIVRCDMAAFLQRTHDWINR